MAWLGFAIAGVPGAIALAAVTFFFAVIQLGPFPVWLPVAIWLGFLAILWTVLQTWLGARDDRADAGA